MDIAAWALLTLAAGRQSQPPETVTFRRLLEDGWQSAIRGPEEPVRKSFATQAEWTEFCKQNGFDRARRPPASVDFEKEIAVAVTLGSRPDPASWIGIVGVDKTKDGVRVRYAVREGRGGASAMDYPHDLIAIPKPAGTVTFDLEFEYAATSGRLNAETAVEEAVSSAEEWARRSKDLDIEFAHWFDAVDFTKRAVVVLALGKRDDAAPGAYIIEIVRVAHGPDASTVSYREKDPPEWIGKAPRNPYVCVLIDKPKGPVKFEKLKR